MPIPVMNFQPETFQQANPMLSGLQAGNALARQVTQNAYLAPMLAQQLQQAQLQNQVLGTQAQFANPMAQNVLQQAQLQNQIRGIQAQYAQPMAQTSLQKAQLSNQVLQAQANMAPQMTQAQLALMRARGSLMGAQTGLTGAQANLLQQKMPYMVQQAQEALYQDPILSRLYQAGLAQKTGDISPNLLSQIGLGQSQQPGMAAASQGGSPLSQQSGAPTQMFPAQGGVGVTPTTAPRLFGGNVGQNWSLFGSPYNPAQMMALKAYGAGLSTQSTTGVTQYNKAQADAAISGQLANQISNLVDQFQKGYAQSTYKGGVLGVAPTTGISSIPFRLGGNLNAEQSADNASQNMAALVAKMIAGGRVTNYEMQYINTLKPNRAMDPQTAQMASDFLKQKSIRLEEQGNFLNAAKNQGVDVQSANALWQLYNNQRPVYDFQTHSANTQFQNSWNDYLTPQAVASVKSGTPYVAIPQFNSQSDFRNWANTLTPADRATAKAQIASQGGQ